MLKLLSVGVQVGLAIAAAVAAGSAFYAWKAGIFNDGVAYERSQRKEADDEAVEKARRGARTVRDCHDAGGVWSQSRGLCDRR